VGQSVFGRMLAAARNRFALMGVRSAVQEDAERDREGKQRVPSGPWPRTSRPLRIGAPGQLGVDDGRRLFRVGFTDYAHYALRD
jgi:hypothetical protein